jgi:hypothetical protein
MAGLGVVVQVRMSAIKPPSSSLKVKYLQLLLAVERQPGLGMEFPLVRPKDMALLLLASGDLLPRQRARDQQADISGSTLKARILKIGLARSRAVRWKRRWSKSLRCSVHPLASAGCCCQRTRRWQAACASPQFVEWLLAQAVREGLAPAEGRRRGRKNRQILRRQTPEPPKSLGPLHNWRVWPKSSDLRPGCYLARPARAMYAAPVALLLWS